MSSNKKKPIGINDFAPSPLEVVIPKISVNKDLVGVKKMSSLKSNTTDSRSIQLKNNLKQLIIENSKLNFMSYEYMENLARNNDGSIRWITDPDINSYREGSLSDRRLGTIDTKYDCATCHDTNINCPGHCGLIKLPYHFINPLASKEVIYCLESVCNQCGSLLPKVENMKKKGVYYLSGSEKLKKIAEMSKAGGGLKCSNKECGGENPKFESKNTSTKGNYKIPFKSNGISNQMSMEEVEQIFSQIPKSDLKIMGFENDMTPLSFILKAIVVIPPTARPDVYQNGSKSEDFITLCYQDFLKDIKKYNFSEKDNEKEIILDKLYYNICHFIDNSDKQYTKSGNDQPILSIKERLTGKTGYIRNFAMGKRNNYGLRSVAGPGSDIPFGYTQIPRYMRKKLTVQEKITLWNYDRLNEKYKNGEIPYVVFNGGKMTHLKRAINEKLIDSHKLNIGDEAFRQLQEGDSCMTNRQPTLHKFGIMGHKIMFHDDLTIKTHSSITSALNLDYDGDEVNVLIMQTQMAMAEAAGIANVTSNIMSNQSNRPMMGLVFNCPVSAWIMSNYKEQISELHWDEAMQYMTRFTDSKRLYTLNDRLEKHNIEKYTGKALLSTLFPEDFYYNSGKVLIKDGILIEGRLSKVHIGPSDGSIIQVLNKMCSKVDLIRFFTEGQFLFNWFIKWHGFSVGYSDCLPMSFRFDKEIVKQNVINFIFSELPLEEKNKGNKEKLEKIVMSLKTKGLSLRNKKDLETISKHILSSFKTNLNIKEILKNVGETNFVRKIVREKMTQAKLQISALEDLGENPTNEDKEDREKTILTILRNINNEVEVYGFKYIDENNPNRLMVQSKSKGSNKNILQIFGFLGQHELDGARPPLTMNKGKRLNSYYEVDDPELEARGFIPENFMEGLSPGSMYTHLSISREGLIDTANKTADVGYLHHKIGKVLEDMFISYNGCVTDRRSIFQFSLLDGFDAGQMTYTRSKATGDVVHFIDFKTVIGKLNNKYSN